MLPGAMGEWSGQTWNQAVGVELDWVGLASAAGAVACRAWEPGVGDAWRAPPARGQRRRHTITNGVDCDLVSGLQGGSGALSILPRIGLGPHAQSPGFWGWPVAGTWVSSRHLFARGLESTLGIHPKVRLGERGPGRSVAMGSATRGNCSWPSSPAARSPSPQERVLRASHLYSLGKLG